MEARVIWVTVTSHPKTWLTALILLNTLNKVHRPFPPALYQTPSHSREAPSNPAAEPVTGGGAPGPGRGSGGGGAIGSTMMSKSETFQGPGGFLTPSNPPTNHTTSKYRDRKRKETHIHTRMHSTETTRG